MDPVSMPGETRDKKLAADRVRRFAVETRTGLGTRSIQSEPLGIYRSRNVTGSLHRSVNIAADLIHTDNEKNLFRALGNSRNPVCITVNVDQNTVFGYCIAA